MSTQLEERTDVKTQTGTEEPIFTHIIDRGDDERPAEAIVLEARVNGTPLTALCGHVWVPQRDPLKYPICDKCKEIFEFALDFRL